MDVPAVADPRGDATLECQFDMGGEELYAVKWYKDDQEFFRPLVVIKDNNLPPPYWIMARVINVHPGGTTSSEQCP
ncbi:unnamed protein product [Acanthoscelides obtectus]|uniref:DUF5641 domain-containing protein n=1 Tax=Acanthoscelides obtectus TaxID=200917 RepID=A0A9P0KEK0_ACAOB|nr:unnamed protein product [Acanthoscelides obtectus]CAK1656017.1 hypothetical protein AOBTE_LOCUS19516 [Acanthoscelides obtectus]